MRTLLSLVFCGLMASSLHASGLSSTACPSATTLQSYEDQFGSFSTPCANGILNYSNFYFQQYSSNGTPLTASQIDLSPTPGVTNGQTGVTGFDITGLDGSISVQPGEEETYVIDWLFVIDAGPVAGGASLGMDPPSGDITITQYYCLDSNFEGGPAYDGSAPTCSTSIEGTTPDVQKLTVSTPDDLTDTVTFNPEAQDYADVMTVIQLDGTGPNDCPDGEGACFDKTTGNSQIDPAPEPGTLVLITGALLVFAFLRKRALTQ
jgi:hypothetical protein